MVCHGSASSVGTWHYEKPEHQYPQGDLQLEQQDQQGLDRNRRISNSKHGGHAGTEEPCKP